MKAHFLNCNFPGFWVFYEILPHVQEFERIEWAENEKKASFLVHLND